MFARTFYKKLLTCCLPLIVMFLQSCATTDKKFDLNDLLDGLDKIESSEQLKNNPDLIFKLLNLDYKIKKYEQLGYIEYKSYSEKRQIVVGVSHDLNKGINYIDIALSSTSEIKINEKFYEYMISRNWEKKFDTDDSRQRISIYFSNRKNINLLFYNYGSNSSKNIKVY